MPMSRITPMTHEIRAAGPAALDAFSVPSSQPEPMTEPAETMKRGSSPTSRLSLGGTSERSAGPLIPLPSLGAKLGYVSLVPNYRSYAFACRHPGLYTIYQTICGRTIASVPPEVAH